MVVGVFVDPAEAAIDEREFVEVESFHGNMDAVATDDAGEKEVVLVGFGIVERVLAIVIGSDVDCFLKGVDFTADIADGVGFCNDPRLIGMVDDQLLPTIRVGDRG